MKAIDCKNQSVINCMK